MRFKQATSFFNLRTILWIFGISLFVLGVLLAYLLSFSPQSIQKSLAISFVEELPSESAENTVDARSIIKDIPYKDTPNMVYDVNPRYKYEATIVDGDGNCSNLVFGLAFFLSEEGLDYQVVHLLPKEQFLFGFGHTVFNMKHLSSNGPELGIVDILEGGLVKDKNGNVTLDALRLGEVEGAWIESFNLKRDTVTNMYGKSLGDAIVGVILHEEMESYFNFIESIYFPLGSKKIEKYLFDGIALMTFQYPEIYVLERDRNRLLGGYGHIVFIAKVFRIALWQQLLLTLILISLIIARLFKRLLGSSEA